jgi:hypothetical protein
MLRPDVVVAEFVGFSLRKSQNPLRSTLRRYRGSTSRTDRAPSRRHRTNTPTCLATASRKAEELTSAR